MKKIIIAVGIVLAAFVVITMKALSAPKLHMK